MVSEMSLAQADDPVCNMILCVDHGTSSCANSCEFQYGCRADRLRRDKLRSNAGQGDSRPTSSSNRHACQWPTPPRTRNSSISSGTSQLGAVPFSGITQNSSNAGCLRAGSARHLHPTVATSKSSTHHPDDRPYPQPRFSYLPRSQGHLQSQTRPQLHCLARTSASAQSGLHDTQPTFVTHATSTYAAPTSTLLDRESPLMDDIHSSEDHSIIISSSSNSEDAGITSNSSPYISPGLFLSRLIKAASTWPEIQQVCLQHSNRFKAHHMATLVTHLAQMQVRGQVPPCQAPPQQIPPRPNPMIHLEAAVIAAVIQRSNLPVHTRLLTAWRFFAWCICRSPSSTRA